jgi:microcystin-dependent protein
MSTRNTSGFNGYPIPIGTIFPFAGNQNYIPRGFLLCDSTDRLIRDYPDLYAVIGSSYGVAPAGYFKVPDLVTNKYIIGKNATNPAVLPPVLARLTDVPILTTNFPTLSSGRFVVNDVQMTAETGADFDTPSPFLIFQSSNTDNFNEFILGTPRTVLKDNSNDDDNFSVNYTAGTRPEYVNNAIEDAIVDVTATGLTVAGYNFCFIIKAYDFAPEPILPDVVPQVPNPTNVYFSCPELSGFVLGS